MIEAVLAPILGFWTGLPQRLAFLPRMPERIDSLALVSLLLVVGLLIGEWLHRQWRWPKVIGYVLAGSLFGPAALNWLKIETIIQARPVADAALGLLTLEVGRRLDLGWLRRNPELLRSAGSDIALSFIAIFSLALWGVGMSPAWAAATATVTMASAPAVVLLTVEEARAQGQVTERIILHTALSSAAAFVAFAAVLSVVHAEQSADWANVVLHPLWVAVGALLVATTAARLTLLLAGLLPKRSLAQVFVLIAMAMLAVGVARMLAVPVFLTLFATGVMLGAQDRHQVLRYTTLPEGHWLLAIVLFVIIGATLPWAEFTWIIGLQALALLVVRALAKVLAQAWAAPRLGLRKSLLVGLGVQPLSATAVFMAYELATLYPEVGRSALTLALFAAAIMELAGPALCRWALHWSGEADPERNQRGGIA